MAKQAITTLKNWFKTSLKPTQQQFWDWLDSYWHKDEAIPKDNIDGLVENLNSMQGAIEDLQNSTGGGISEAPTTVNAVYARSGENEDWAEAVPMSLQSDKEILLNEHALDERNLDGLGNTTYQLEKKPTYTKRRFFNGIFSSTHEQNADVFHAEVSDGSVNTYFTASLTRITTAINNLLGFFYVRLEDDIFEVSAKLKGSNVEEKANVAGKYLLIRDEATGIVEKISVANLGLGDPNYKGYYFNEADLITAFPAGQSGWHAFVDLTGEPVQHYAWDVTESSWRSTGSVQTITEVPDSNNYLRTIGGWVQGVLKSTYDTFVTTTNSAISTINTTLLSKENIVVPYVYKANLTAINPTTERRITVNVSGNTALSFSRALVNGESGVINITNNVATSSVITLPTNSISESNGGATIITTAIINSKDRITWEYDGINIWWTFGENYN